LDFDIGLSTSTYKSTTTYEIFMDGRCSGRRLPLKLDVCPRSYSSFDASEKSVLEKTAYPHEPPHCQSDDDMSRNVLILSEDESLGKRLEKWALDYASLFAQTSLSGLPYTMGVKYVAKRLPEARIKLVIELQEITC
jgi:hypothetical protein